MTHEAFILYSVAEVLRVFYSGSSKMTNSSLEIKGGIYEVIYEPKPLIASVYHALVIQKLGAVTYGHCLTRKVYVYPDLE